MTNMDQFKFGPARPGEPTVFGAQRPGYNATLVGEDLVEAWIDFMKRNNIARVCCLLPPEQLAFYKKDLLASYRRSFGSKNVSHVEAKDCHLCDPSDLDTKILPFLRESEEEGKPVVVHCSGGSGRTGHVLAAWLVRQRGLSVDEAVDAVRGTGRNPCEAVDCGNATARQFKALLAGSKQ